MLIESAMIGTVDLAQHFGLVQRVLAHHALSDSRTLIVLARQGRVTLHAVRMWGIRTCHDEQPEFAAEEMPGSFQLADIRYAGLPFRRHLVGTVSPVTA